MHKRFVFLLILIFGFILFNLETVRAISNNIVISYVQLGDAVSSSNEIVEIFNNSNDSVEITNWCLYYASASNTAIGSKMGCFIPENFNTHVYLPANKSAIFISNQLHTSSPEIKYDEKFSATLSGLSGHIRLLDSNKNEIDKVGWGLAVSPETKSTNAPLAGNILKRKIISENKYIDTDNNFDDFEIVASDLSYENGNVFEVDDLCLNIENVQSEILDGLIVNEFNQCVAPPTDVCLNIEDLQITVPIGFTLNELNECVPDLCINIDGIQSEIPDGYVQNDYSCDLPDLCLNLENIQNPIPPGYYQNDYNECYLDLSKIIISELMPNAIGSDVGNEYIEIYNPNNFEINLANYQLQIMPNGDVFSFPLDTIIKPNEYLVFDNNQIKFTLLNTTSSANLISADNQIIDSTEIYQNPDEGNSWSKINDIWQYTNRPTPGLENLFSEIVEEPLIIPCGPNQYRNLETGRCRNISSGSVLIPCRDGQYRSEETGRCRNIVSDISNQMPCAEGEERNPDTNRCRKITGSVLGANDLKPCAANQYRNPETNRCKNIISLASADYQPQNITASNDSSLISLSYLAVLLLAIIYGIWEWRTDIVKLFKKFRNLVHFR